MKRAYSTIEIKSIDEGGAKRTFRGIASTPTPDRMGDIVEPKGAQFELPLPLLWQHDSYDPIGWITKASVTDKGIEVEGEIADIPEAGPLRDRLLTAWQYLKSKLVRGLSIGFRSLEEARIKDTYSYHILKWTWLELSAVTIPANQDASITAIKSIDRQHLAALGRKGPPDDPTRPGASGQRSGAPSGALSHSRSQKGKDTMNLKEMIEARATKNARLKELIDARTAESRAFTDEEGAEFDALTDEVKALDDDIRVAKYHQVNGAQAKAVDVDAHNGRRSGPTILVKKEDPDDTFKGQAQTRLFIAKALAFMSLKDGNYVSPAQIAEQRWGKSHPKLVQYIKAAVAGAGTGSGEWGAELAQSDTRYTGDFIEFLYSQTIYDRLPLRPVPARIRIKGQDGAATGYWVGESKAIPVSMADFSDVELLPLKVGALAVCSKEWVRDASPAGEMLIRDAIVQASSQRVDTTFLSAAAASSGVSPAGLLNGVSAVSATGVDADALRADFQLLMAPFIAAKNSLGLHLVTTPSLGMAIGMLVNALGQSEFPGVSENGGTLFNKPLHTGDNVGPGDLIALKPSDIWKIDDRGVEVSMSDQATIEQNDAPQGASDTPTAASATLMSMFQTESIAFKVVRSINFAKRRSHAVQFIGNANYGVGVGQTTS
jgi:HK97 family phage prohead protease/HK97 family phage major capsid protein